jgi:hypothetical protein
MLGEFGATKALIVATNEATIRQDEAEHHKTREYFTTNQDSVESRRDREAQMKQFLSSLADEEMNARRNQIERSHTDTFSWVFDEEIQRPWDSFTDWLHSDDSLYWICGKAGSGKSTLMKFLINDKRTVQYLKEWAPGCSIYSHFIWNSGTRVQRSILGLLRSIIYQILDENQHILDNVLQIWPKVSKIKNSHDWSRDTLEEVLLHSLSLHEKGVCIFVDGLDEIDPKDGSFDLLSLVKRISSPSENKGVKVCVSSRPETSFKLGLERCPTLRLQDLTRRDMEIYATDFVRSKCSFNLSSIKKKSFIDEIVTKSDGVFLWVSLALKSLQRGSINGDDPSTLMERLRALPSELGKLYEEMLTRLGDDQDLYSKETALIFNIFLFFADNFRPANLFRYAVAFDPTLRDVILKPKSLPSPRSLKEALLDVDRKLATRCAGMLEVVNSGTENTQTIEQVLSGDKKRPWGSITIEFIHRSAKDFLLSMKHELLYQDTTSAAERKLQVLQAIALDDLYWDNERRYLHGMDECTAMDMILNTEPILSDTEELIVLKLIQEVYQRKGWPEFYELAARYGFYQPHAQLLESSSGDLNALLDYLLLCTLSYNTKRTYTTASYFLDMGADPNYVAFIPTYRAGPATEDSLLYLPTPLLSLFLKQEIPQILGEAMCFTGPVVELIHLFITFGAEIERKFLSMEFGGEPGYLFRPGVARPVYDIAVFGKRGRVDFLFEINCVDLILAKLAQSRSVAYEEKLEIIKHLGLDVARAHHKILLYFRGDIVYGVNNEESDAMNEIWGWPLSRMPHDGNVNSGEDGGDGMGSDESDNSDNSDGSNSSDTECVRSKTKNRFEKSYELLKGNEVHDIREWLSGRGYTLPEEKGFVWSSQASIHEMAEVYKRLNERFGLR